MGAENTVVVCAAPLLVHGCAFGALEWGMRLSAEPVRSEFGTRRATHAPGHGSLSARFRRSAPRQ